MTPITYEGFDHQATDLARFLLTSGIFTIVLKNKEIVHFFPKDAEGFKAWLLDNNIQDARKAIFFPAGR